MPDLDQRFVDLLVDMKAMHMRKMADYGRDTDPYANVRASEDFGIPGWLGAAIRLNDKVRRLQTFAQKGNLQNESIEDSFMDLAVYALIGLLLYREEQKAKVDQTLEELRTRGEKVFGCCGDPGDCAEDCEYPRSMPEVFETFQAIRTLDPEPPHPEDERPMIHQDRPALCATCGTPNPDWHRPGCPAYESPMATGME